MEINYKMAFETLVRQIKQEYKWSKEDYDRKYQGLNMPTLKSTKGCTQTQFWMVMGEFGHERFGKGELCAYGSLERFAKNLEKRLEEGDIEGYVGQIDEDYIV